MEINSVYHVSQHYNSHHDMGLFIVTKKGKKFWTLHPIEVKAFEEAKVVSDPAYWQRTGKRIAVRPIVKSDGQKHLLVSFDNYHAEDDTATTSDRGSECYKSFERVLPDKNNDYIYESSSEHYG